MKKWKVTLTVETERALTIGEPNIAVWCAHCRRTVRAATPDALAAAAGISLQSVNRAIEERRLHLVNADEGLARVCLRSAGKLE